MPNDDESNDSSGSEGFFDATDEFSEEFSERFSNGQIWCRIVSKFMSYSYISAVFFDVVFRCSLGKEKRQSLFQILNQMACSFLVATYVFLVGLACLHDVMRSQQISLQNLTDFTKIFSSQHSKRQGSGAIASLQTFLLSVNHILLGYHRLTMHPC